jgi:hypothetical protein
VKLRDVGSEDAFPEVKKLIETDCVGFFPYQLTVAPFGICIIHAEIFISRPLPTPLFSHFIVTLSSFYSTANVPRMLQLMSGITMCRVLETC